MARYKLTITGEIDGVYPLSCHSDVMQSLINYCCPSDLGLHEGDCIIDCKECWLQSLEIGAVLDDTEDIHVERLNYEVK